MPRNHNKERNQGNKKEHTYHLPILCLCGWEQLFNFDDLADAAVFTAGSTGTTTLLSTKQHNAVFQQPCVHMLFHT